MKKFTAPLLIILLSLLYSPTCYADVAVVVHPENGNQLDDKAVRKIYLAKVRKFPNGDEVIPIDMEVGTPARTEFNRKVLRKDETSLNSYWARMLFSSKGKPPKVLEDAKEMKKVISENRNAIGYLDAGDVDESVRVLFTIKE